MPPKVLCLPASAQMINVSALADTEFAHISVEEGNCHFSVSGDFLLDFEGRTVVRYFGSDADIVLNRDIEVLGTKSFSNSKSIASLTFESGSKLARIEPMTFRGCSSLESITIPQSIKEMRKDWALGSSLRTITFESASSVRWMIETGRVDFSGFDFEIKILHCDCSLEFLESSFRTAPGPHNSVYLAKLPSLIP
jgi:hypothetical protein